MSTLTDVAEDLRSNSIVHIIDGNVKLAIGDTALSFPPVRDLTDLHNYVDTAVGLQQLGTELLKMAQAIASINFEASASVKNNMSLHELTHWVEFIAEPYINASQEFVAFFEFFKRSLSEDACKNWSQETISYWTALQGAYDELIAQTASFEHVIAEDEGDA